MLFRTFCYLLIALVIALPTWVLWSRQQLVFCDLKTSDLNEDAETFAIYAVPFILTGVLLFAVFGLAYPKLGFFKDVILAVVLTVSSLNLLKQVLALVKRRERIIQIFDRWKACVGENAELWFSCGGVRRQLLIKDEYIVFSLGRGPLDGLSNSVSADLKSLYRQISTIDGEHFARIGPDPESFKEVLEPCKAFPRAEYVYMRSDSDSFRFKC